jgi:rod shape-determining protein MreD
MMKPYLVLLPIFLLALIQGAFLPINLVLLIALFWAMVRPERETFMVAFLSGLFLDLTKGTPLGFSSVYLLLTSAFVLVYSRRFDPAHPVFLPLVVFLSSLVFNLALKEPWLTEGLVLALMALLARPLVRYYHEDVEKDQLKLKLE